MRKVVESLKRLYDAGRISKEQLMDRVEKCTITIDEYNYIVGEETEE